MLRRRGVGDLGGFADKGVNSRMRQDKDAEDRRRKSKEKDGGSARESLGQGGLERSRKEVGGGQEVKLSLQELLTAVRWIKEGGRPRGRKSASVPPACPAKLSSRGGCTDPVLRSNPERSLLWE